jgi:hypothetical protein
MIILWRGVGVLLWVLVAHTLSAQAVIQEKSSLIYTVTGVDSVVRAQKNSTYDAWGRLLSSKNYYYNLSSPGVLTKEESSNYNPTTKLLTETITRYPKNEEPQTERLETFYLDYQPKEQDSKRIWRRHYDRFGELTKEDTLTYNDAQQLINNCQYNYTGSTSLLCDEYQYKDTLRTRWLMFSKWNTINVKSEVVEKQTKRRDYRYRYNRRGQLKRIRAKDYSSKIRRYLCYDQQGRLEEDRLVVRRKVTRAVRDEEGKKTDKTKKFLQKTENIVRYEDGRIVEERRTLDGKETKREVFVYQDSLLEKTSTFLQEQLTEEVQYTYKEGRLAEKNSYKYDPKGNLRYSTRFTYNDLEQLVARTQIARDQVLSTTEWIYDAMGNPLSQTSYRPSNSSKKRPNSMARPKEKIVYIYTYH